MVGSADARGPSCGRQRQRLGTGARRDSPFVWWKGCGGRWVRIDMGALERPRRGVIHASVADARERRLSYEGSCTQHVRASKRGIWSQIVSRVVESLGGDTERTARANVRVMERSSLVRLVAGEGLRTRARPSSKHSSRWVSRGGRHGAPVHRRAATRDLRVAGHAAGRAATVRSSGLVPALQRPTVSVVGRQPSSSCWSTPGIRAMIDAVSRPRWVFRRFFDGSVRDPKLR